jgi:hypothetical protein
MRIALAISMTALAIAAFAAPSYAQSNQRGNRSFSSGGSQFSQRSISRQPSFSQRSFSQGNFSQRFQQRRFQPNTPGTRVGTAPSNRSFRSLQPRAPGARVAPPAPGNRAIQNVAPPAPGTQVGSAPGNSNVRSFQPATPGAGVAPPAPGNRSFRSIQPQAPGSQFGSAPLPQAPGTRVSSAPGGASSPIQSVRPPFGNAPVTPPPSSSAVIPTAATIGDTPAPTTPAAPAVDTATVGAPIESATSGETTTSGAMPPVEMLAQIGDPIVPLSKTPATPVVAEKRPVTVVRVRGGAEYCAPPVYHHRRHYGRHFYGGRH